MKYGEILKSDKIASSVVRGFEQSVGVVKKGAMVVKDKTGHMTREGVRQLAELESRSKKTIKKIFKKAA
jgi:hypothetical protein